MMRQTTAAALALLAATATIFELGCRTGNSPSTGNFTIFTKERVTFTGLYGGTFENEFSVEFRAQSHAPYGPNLIGTKFDFWGESGRDGIYRAFDAVVPAKWGVDQTSGPCRNVPGTITATQLHLGEAYVSICRHSKNVVGLVNTDGDGVIFDGGCCDTNTMESGTTIYEGQTITSQDNRFKLVYQGDGNLVLYREDGARLWTSGTGGHEPGEVRMDTDGALVIFGPYPTIVWSHSTDSPGARLVVQNDGNMVIYSTSNEPLWATNTCCH